MDSNIDNFSELKEKGFSSDQINQILKFESEGYKYTYDITPSICAAHIRFLRHLYKKQTFSPVVFASFVKKFNEGIDVSKYFNEEYETLFTPVQLDVLCSCQDYNLKNPAKDFSKLINPSFNSEQMIILKNIIIKGKINYKIFNSNIPSENMKIIAKANENGIDDDLFYDFSFSSTQLETLIRAKTDGLDLKYIANPNFSIECMNALISALKDGIDIKDIASEYYSVEDLHIFISAIKKGFDIKPLLNLELTMQQRKIIIQGMYLGIDYMLYANPKFDARQMEVIKLFLENNFNPEEILDKKYSSEKMMLLFELKKEGIEDKTILNDDITDQEAKSICSLLKKGYKINK